jgi:hypothetical protein
LLTNLRRSLYHNRKWKSVRKSLVTGNSSSLWKAVKTAKDVNTNALPNKMYEVGNDIDPGNIPMSFAKFFNYKIKEVLTHTSLNENVYNG